MGLEWKDIDWEHNIISVRRTSNYTADKGIYTDTTKSPSVPSGAGDAIASVLDFSSKGKQGA